jgi:hypothetical protein
MIIQQNNKKIWKWNDFSYKTFTVGISLKGNSLKVNLVNFVNFSHWLNEGFNKFLLNTLPIITLDLENVWTWTVAIKLLLRNFL